MYAGRGMPSLIALLGMAYSYPEAGQPHIQDNVGQNGPFLQKHKPCLKMSEPTTGLI